MPSVFMNVKYKNKEYMNLYLILWMRYLMPVILIIGGLYAVVPVMTYATQTTNNHIVQLRFIAPAYVTHIKLSNSPDFFNPTTYPYTGSQLSWDICGGATRCSSGVYSVYVQFLKDAEVVKELRDSITYNKPVPILPVEPIEQPEPETIIPEPEVITHVVTNIVTEPQPATFNIAQIIGMIIASIGILATLSSTLLSFISSIFRIPEFIIALPIRIWNVISILLGLRRKSEPWGVVYDSISKQPLDPAYVTLLGKDGKEIATSITDINGRYGFLVSPGIYVVNVGKTHYHFPSTRMQGRTSDALYQDLYFGEDVGVGENQVITKNIPMDPDVIDWNQEEKKRMGVGYISGVSVTVAIISDILLYVGFIVTAIFLLAKPTTWGFIFLGIYAIVFFFRALGIKPRAYGRIHQDSNNSSLAYAIIRVFSTQLRREVAHAVLDIRGRYFCLVPKGEYYLVIERKISDEQYQPIFTSDSIFASNGIINKSFDLSFIS